MNKFYLKKDDTKTIFLSGSIIGFLVFIFIFTFSSLNVTSDFFCSVGFLENDIAQHYSGWMLFRQSDWSFPLGVSLNAAFPYGTSVSYTDSIPIFSIFFKLLSPILPSTFQFFGIFVAMSYSLMGGFSAILMNLFIKNYFISCLSAVLFCFSPIMMERAFRHTALSAHFLIIACLYYYFKNKGNWNFKNSIPLIIINTLAISIHPYFLPFTFGISFAVFLEWAISKKEFIKSLSFILISLFSALVFGYIIGAFYSFDSAGDIGYGIFSLNLNSYFNPSSNRINDWSAFRNPLALASPYQVEAFNYLGFGVILAIFISFLIFVFSKNIRKNVLDILKSSYGLIFTALALTIFALTNTITFHSFTLISIPIPSIISDIASIFRASGRFGWLLHYLFYIIAIFCISKINLKSLNIILLSVFILIQIIDLFPAISYKQDYFKNSAPYENVHTRTKVLTDEFWDVLFNDYNSMISILNPSNIDNNSIEYAIRAGKKDSDMTINVAFEARAINNKREEFTALVYQDLLNGNIDENTMYLIDDAADFSKFISSGEYQAFNINGEIILIKSKYTDAQLESFLNSKTFSQINF